MRGRCKRDGLHGTGVERDGPEVGYADMNEAALVKGGHARFHGDDGYVLPTFGPLTTKSGGESKNLGARFWIPKCTASTLYLR